MNAARRLLISAAIVAGLIAPPALAQTVVSTPPFNAIELEGGGHVVLKHGSVQQVRLIKGSTAYTRFIVDEPHKLRIEACNGNCPRHYDLEIEVTTPGIDALAVSGGGSIDGSGAFPGRRKLTMAVQGGGTIDARAMDSAGATAAVDGGGLILVKAHDELTAAINGGGRIKYWGNPKVTEAVSGGGEVRRGD